jgi:hypothetical protein
MHYADSSRVSFAGALSAAHNAHGRQRAAYLPDDPVR